MAHVRMHIYCYTLSHVTIINVDVHVHSIVRVGHIIPRWYVLLKIIGINYTKHEAIHDIMHM